MGRTVTKGSYIMKLYIVVRQDLKPGSQIAQSIHAFREFIQSYPENEKKWYKLSNTVVILGCESESELISLIRQANKMNIKYSEFREPDMNEQITACTFEPGEKSSNLLSSLSLALKDTNR